MSHFNLAVDGVEGSMNPIKSHRGPTRLEIERLANGHLELVCVTERRLRFPTRYGPGQLEDAIGEIVATLPVARAVPDFRLDPSGLSGTDAARQLLAQEGVRAAIERLTPSAIEVCQGRLRVLYTEVPGLEHVLGLAEALRRDEWAELGESFGCERVGRGLAGDVDGHSLVIVVNDERDTLVHLGGSFALLADKAGTVFAHSTKLDNPILDRFVALSGDKDDLRRRMSDPEAVEALLEVVHGHPGSRIDAEGITLVFRGIAVQELPELVAKVRRLAKALKA